MTLERVEFLGELDGAFLTYAQLVTTLGVREGILSQSEQTDRWLHFMVGKRRLLVSKVPVCTAISYNHLYSLGLVYGTDDTGVRVPTRNYNGGPVNQFRTIVNNGRVYKVRLLQGDVAGADPYVGQSGVVEKETSRESEWSHLLHWVANDGAYGRAVGSARYSGEDLQLYDKEGDIYSWCQETAVCSTTVPIELGAQRLLRGGWAGSKLTLDNSSAIDARYGWRPCLELHWPVDE